MTEDTDGTGLRGHESRRVSWHWNEKWSLGTKFDSSKHTIIWTTTTRDHTSKLLVFLIFGHRCTLSQADLLDQ